MSKKLRNAKAEHQIISVSPDLTPFQREEVRKALSEVKHQNSTANQSVEKTSSTRR